MIVLSRKKNESIHIGEGVMLTVVEIRGDKVRLGLVAPKDMPVYRKELWDSVYGPPPSAKIDPAWLAWNDGTVLRLARTIAAERNYDALPILADALEEAGCTDAVMLRHCRTCAPDVPTSWVVNLILLTS